MVYIGQELRYSASWLSRVESPVILILGDMTILTQFSSPRRLSGRTSEP